jgi:hypothetical protein
MSQTIDVTPLPKPVNACRWNAAQLRAQLNALGAQLTPDQRQRLEQSAAWLEELGRHVPFAHTNPLLLIAIGNLALAARDRDEFTAALHAISEITARAQAGGPVPTNGSAGGWAPVE